MEKNNLNAKRMFGYAVVGLLVLASLPTLGVAANKVQDVFVTNDPEHPVSVAGEVAVSNFPASAPAPEDLSGAKILSNGFPQLDLPAGLMLTDLVAHKFSGEPGPCGVTLWNSHDTGGFRAAHLEPTYDVRDELHFETGVEINAPGFSVFKSSGVNCAVSVVWSGYMPAQ